MAKTVNSLAHRYVIHLESGGSNENSYHTLVVGTVSVGGSFPESYSARAFRSGCAGLEYKDSLKRGLIESAPDPNGLLCIQ